jgi:hypothetical protein
MYGSFPCLTIFILNMTGFVVNITKVMINLREVMFIDKSNKQGCPCGRQQDKRLWQHAALALDMLLSYRTRSNHWR